MTLLNAIGGSVRCFTSLDDTKSKGTASGWSGQVCVWRKNFINWKPTSFESFYS